MLDPLDPAGTYDRLPFVFSDQYDLGLEYTGHLDRGPMIWWCEETCAPTSSSRSGCATGDCAPG